MDDFSVYGSSFENCLKNLETVLKRCQDKNLALNWEKCHFMVTEGIVSGHKISTTRLEVNQAKVYVIETLMPPTTVKGYRSFLGHAGFYRRFIKDFSKKYQGHYADFLKRKQNLNLMNNVNVHLKRSRLG